MRCIIHVWTSLERGSKLFSLRLLPLNTSDLFQSLEVFQTEEDLSRRLTELGLSSCHCEITLHDLQEGQPAMWTNIEIKDEAARSGTRRNEPPPIAA